MRTGLDPYIRVRFDGGESPRAPLPEGATLDVEVVSRSSDGTLRVRVAGRILTAAALGAFEPGDAFAATVRRSRGEVFLDPVRNPASARAGFLARLGLPDTPAASSLVLFFERSLYKLDTALCRSLLALASRFPGREKRAAEAAALLETHGLRADEESVALLMDAIEGPGPRGDTDARDTDDDGAQRRTREFLAFLNHKKGHERHWIVVPFTRDVGGRAVRGSLRCMIDLATSRCVETILTINDEGRVWDFNLTGARCEFRANPPFSPVKNGEIAVYLRNILASAGYTEVRAYDSVGDFARSFPAIDLEA